jgi:hypothetical protein
MNRTTFTLIFLSIITIGLFSCRKDTNHSPDRIMGVISGKVVTENTQKAISRALVFVDDHGDIYFTYSNVDGSFSLSAPAGEQLLQVQTGDGSIYRSAMQVEIVPNDIVELQQLFGLGQVGRIAYVSGAYDEIETIIEDSLGYTATAISYADLSNFSYISTFDAIFLNCNSNLNISSEVSTNLRNFAGNGGSLYASDWAVRYLIGNRASGNNTCPGTFSNGFIASDKLCTRRTGARGWIMNASIVSADLQGFLGSNSMDVDYDLGNWEAIHLVDGAFFETLVTNGSEPLMVRTNKITAEESFIVGSGNSEWVTICHIPPGNPNNPITITINVSGLQAHLDHGDNIGACANGGNIYYTTFHNHPGDHASADVMSILEYVILNL